MDTDITLILREVLTDARLDPGYRCIEKCRGIAWSITVIDEQTGLTAFFDRVGRLHVHNRTDGVRFKVSETP